MQPVAVLRGHAAAVNCCKFDSAYFLASGYSRITLIITSDAQGDVRIWDVRSKKCETWMKNVHSEGVLQVDFLASHVFYR